ncbi:MAG: hypothetical protein ACYCRH_12475 [Acidiferrobacteraceae bacterium]
MQPTQALASSSGNCRVVVEKSRTTEVEGGTVPDRLLPQALAHPLQE